MKKILLSIAIVIGVSSFAKADLFDRQKDKTMMVRSTMTVSANASTTTILIDLSSTSAFNGWPHQDNREINISGIEISWDKIAASSCSVKIGVVTFVNTSTGSVTWFASNDNERNVSNTKSYSWISPIEGYYKCRVNSVQQSTIGVNTDGLTPYILTNDKTSGSTTFQTDVNLPSPLGNRFPGVGDIVATAADLDQLVAMDLRITIFYWSEPR